MRTAHSACCLMGRSSLNKVACTSHQGRHAEAVSVPHAALAAHTVYSPPAALYKGVHSMQNMSIMCIFLCCHSMYRPPKDLHRWPA